MLNFCVVTSHKEISSSEITFLKNKLNAERVDVLGSCGVQFQVDPENITEKLKIHPVKFVDELFTIALKTKPTRLKPRQKKPLEKKDTGNDISKNLQ